MFFKNFEILFINTIFIIRFVFKTTNKIIRSLFNNNRNLN